MTCLALASEDEKVLKYVTAAISPAWPEGLASLAVETMFNIYQPKDKLSKFEMTTEIQKLKIKERDDPADFFSALSQLEIMFQKKLTLEDSLAFVLQKCPTTYQGVISGEIRQRKELLTLKDVSDAMSTHYRTLAVSKAGTDDDSDSDSEAPEVGLMATDAVVSRGCGYCGNVDHNCDNCPKRITDENLRGHLQSMGVTVVTF